MRRLKVLLVEPWMSGSHAQWAWGYQEASAHDVSIVGLSDGPWRWRLRAGAWPLSRRILEHISRNGVPDAVVISGLVDVAQLLGFVRRSLPAATPVTIYQHESQLLYPTVNGNVDDEAALRNWSSWQAADRVLFNSNFHRDAVVAALPTFLERQPDHDQVSALQTVIDRFAVVPVGIDIPSASEPVGTSRDGTAAKPQVGSSAEPPEGRVGSAPLIVWPHRWEPDKNPDVFVRALAKLDQAGLDFGLVLAGHDALVPSDARRLILDRWGDRVVAAGPFEREQYQQWLVEADIVVSCADHDFFGVGIAEALAAGCFPVLPRALAYPELVDERWESFAFYPHGRFGSRLADVVGSFAILAPAIEGLAASMVRFAWDNVASQLDQMVADTLN